ncbi:MAG: hypothetical protein HY836_14065 [Aquabacterium sp.]|uniref:hypothetical protein n=1 Tax=Aquabacterium sp. TaxID=1872578 RepID=UPI0025BFE821|nr:hypothetical protein [Aquabacterium sp.]MBI5926711.1 hypothetical protein [Aquabacterium sp.]
MTVQQCWIWLITTCFSPRFHTTFLAARARSNFASANLYRRVMTVMWLSTGVTMATALHVWIPVLVLLVFPLTVLYQISALIQFTSEHYWGAPFIEGETSPERHARLSQARYCLTAMPQRNGNGLARFAARLVLWALIVVLIDIPARIAILVGELVVHDRHHRFPAEKSWALALYLPEDEQTVHRSRENWGLIGALNAVFRHVYALGPQAA